MPTVAEILHRVRGLDSEKEVGSFAAAVLLDQEPMLLRLVSVWPNVPVAPLPAAMECPTAVAEGRWTRWMWSVIEPDPIPAWVATAGLPDAPHIRRLCLLAIDNRMVFPDGGVSLWAGRVVQQAAVGAALRRGAAGPGQAARRRRAEPQPQPAAEERDGG